MTNKIFVLMIFTLGVCYGKQVIKLPFAETPRVLNLAKHYLSQAPVIVDAGAYEGSEIHEMKKVWPNATIHAFEPVPQIFNRLQKNVVNYPQIFCYPIALSEKNGTASFILSEEPGIPGIFSQSSSILKPKEHLNLSSTLFKKSIEVPTITLDTWATQHNISSVDFIWFDLQGYELPVFKAALNVLKTAKVIYTEVESVEAYAGQALYKEVQKWLEEQGFVLIAQDFDPNSYWFGNFLFVKKDLVR